ncbi:MAG: A/G-specific adenine glycosylase [Crocinitomicaceae bacterium]|nr:A/G-specific adenine glycosylase [Crocinitomicaceae bacterium]
MRDFSALIKNWYLQNRRNLPWRATNDPYKIWLSEIILQQTRVEQGMSYYLKFIEHYPTVKDLAEATEDEVLKDWQGLGYYSRARNLHAAAKYIHNELEGKFPTTYKEILQLKGVGEYTASAISSIVFGLPKAVVDGNVYRVLSRLLNEDTPIDTTQGKKLFVEAAQELLDENDPSTHNQAVMELGALVCTPKNPDCDNCPVWEKCLSYEKGTQLTLPVKSKKTKVTRRFLHYFLLLCDEHLLIRKRGTNDIWRGLYDFPVMELPADREPTKSELKQFNITSVTEDGQFKHVLSHQHIFAQFWMAEVHSLPEIENSIRVHINDLDSYPMPRLLIRYLESSQQFAGD